MCGDNENVTKGLP